MYIYYLVIKNSNNNITATHTVKPFCDNNLCTIAQFVIMLARKAKDMYSNGR